MLFVKPSTVESVCDQLPSSGNYSPVDGSMLARLVRASIQGMPQDLSKRAIDTDMISSIIDNSKQVTMHESLMDEDVEQLLRVSNAQIGFVRNVVSYIVDDTTDKVTTLMESELVLPAPIVMQPVQVPTIFENQNYLTRIHQVSKLTTHANRIERGQYAEVGGGALDDRLTTLPEYYAPIFEALQGAGVEPEDIYNRRVAMVNVEGYPESSTRVFPWGVRFDLLEMVALGGICRVMANAEYIDATVPPARVSTDLFVLGNIAETFAYRRVSNMMLQISSGVLVDEVIVRKANDVIVYVYDASFKTWTESTLGANADALFGAVLVRNGDTSALKTPGACEALAMKYREHLVRLQTLQLEKVNSSRTTSTLKAVFNYINGDTYPNLGLNIAPSDMCTQVGTYVREHPCNLNESTESFVERVLCAGMLASRDTYRILTLMKDIELTRPGLPIGEVSTIMVIKLLVETLVNTSVEVSNL